VFGVAFRETVNPAKFGVVLTFALATMYCECEALTLLNQPSNSWCKISHSWSKIW